MSSHREKNVSTDSTHVYPTRNTSKSKLANGNLLAKCMHGRTQNSNASLKNEILNPVLKVSF
jgi:hypothetical protein